MKAQTASNQINKAFNLKSIELQPVNRYGVWDSYGNFYHNVLTINRPEFNKVTSEGTYYDFAIEMLEDRMAISIELDREWVDRNGVSHEEELMNYSEELPYTKESIKEVKELLKTFSMKATHLSKEQTKDRFLTFVLSDITEK